jgi:tRNA threonylcarbamoyladenosine biosynthesis protein TsaB
MTILGIETATERLGAAILTGDGRLFERHTDSHSSHCELLAGFITELAEESGAPPGRFGCVAVSTGPGSFTGLRIGIATAMGLSYGLGIPACGVNTLAALAWGSSTPGVLACPIIDAGRGEVYAAVYRLTGGVPETVVEPAAIPIAHLADILRRTGEPVTVTGPASEARRPLLEASGGPLLSFAGHEMSKPSAASVARLGLLLFESGMGGSPASLTPVYLRRADAEFAKPKPPLFNVT